MLVMCLLHYQHFYWSAAWSQ